MTRLWTSPDQRSERALPAVRTRLRSGGGSPPPDAFDVLGPSSSPGSPGPAGSPGSPGSSERYPTSRLKPTSQLMARGGLLVAVAIGCLGGLVGLLRPSGDGGSEAPPPSPDAGILPGSVAGVAEEAVVAWLTAPPGDDDEIGALFVEPPAPVAQGRDDAVLTVGDATAVAGEELEDGYWTVIVAVDVIDPPPPSEEDAAAEEEADATATALGTTPGEAAAAAREAAEAGRSTWYVEIGIVGNDAGGLAALTTPGVLPGPVDLETGWTRDGPAVAEPEPDDPLVAMLGSFLDALLAGRGDPAPYLASGVDIPMVSPPPFADVTVDGLAVVEQDGGELRVWVEATATTPSDTQVPVAYEVVVVPRSERFDVVEFWGSPAVTGSPNPPAEEDDGAEGEPAAPDTTSADAGTTTAETTTTFASEPGA